MTKSGDTKALTNRHRLVLRFGVVAAMTATLAAGGAGTAFARPGAESAVQPGGAQTADPRTDLDKVADSLSLRHKSVTVVVEAAGNRVKKPVQISLAYGEGNQHRSSSTYIPGSGNRFRHDFEVEDGAARREKITINLNQTDASRQIVWYTDVEPLWDVVVSPLKFTLHGDCDVVGDSEVLMSSSRPDHSSYERQVDMSDGETYTLKDFAWTGRDVTLAQGLVQPTFAWREDDTYAVQGFTGQGSSETPMLPGTTRTISTDTGDQDGSSCFGHIEWTETIKLRSYPAI